MILTNIYEAQTKVQTVKLSYDDRLNHQYVSTKWNVDINPLQRITKTCTWLKPLQGFISLGCDGSVDVNRNGHGGILRGHTGMAIITCAGITPNSHVLWVELFALYRGLDLVAAQGITFVEICMDSKLAVEILQNNYKCPWHVMILVGKIKQNWKGCIRSSFSMFGDKQINLWTC